MTMRVLQTRQQIAEARREMAQLGISSIDRGMAAVAKTMLRRAGLPLPGTTGDITKSWDVLSTATFLEGRLSKDAPILDLGCFASEILLALDKAGFRCLTGVDLNPQVRDMPTGRGITYKVANFMDTGLPENSFQAITAISVIEHGFDGPRLLREVSRLLSTGGIFVASFDYWPEKIDTGNTRFFDMDWLIFSREDVASLVEEAATHHLTPVSDMQFEGQTRPIRHAGFDYTFAWLCLEKRPGG